MKAKLVLIFLTFFVTKVMGQENIYLTKASKPLSNVSLSGGEGSGGGGPSVQRELERVLRGRYEVTSAVVRQLQLAGRGQRGFEIVVPQNSILGLSSKGKYVDILDQIKEPVEGFEWKPGQLKIEVTPGSEGTIFLQNGNYLDLKEFVLKMLEEAGSKK